VIPAVTGCVPVASADDFGYLAMRTAVAHAGSMTTDSASSCLSLPSPGAAAQEIFQAATTADSWVVVTKARPARS
jgi:hypothetical protein